MMLVYVGINKHDTKLYADPQNRIAVKMEDIVSLIDKAIWVNDQGDQYMAKNGTRYVPTDFYEDMDAFGWIQSNTSSEYPQVHDIYG